jgi:Flp pilus assembly protein TadD
MARKMKGNRARAAVQQPNASAARGPVGSFLHSHGIEIAICLGLVVATLLVFVQVRGFQFVNLDDHKNVYENPAVNNGLTLDSVKWAFTATERDYWQPLSWISHILDAQLFGMHPGGHHLTSVYLHILNAILLFLVLRRMTGAVWRSAMVAALFAIHPLRAESVAWVTERKDVLAGLFWWLTTWAYIEYVKDTASWRRYALVMALFGMALMAKPTVITLPFFLLLLDYWPLKRSWKRSWGQPRVSLVDTPDCPHNHIDSPPDHLHTHIGPHVILEKIPLFVLSGVIVFFTFKAQSRGGATEMIGNLSLPARMANSLVAYATYLLNAVWPYPLAATYPYNQHLPAWQVAAAGLLVAGVSALVIWKTARFPYLLVGWLWYLGLLLPVIGLVQIGFQARADRFTYIPLTGFFLMIVWLLDDLMAGWKRRRVTAVAMAAIILPALGVRAWSQVGYWHDSITLLQQNLTVTPENKWALNGLATAFASAGRLDESMAAYRKAAALDPGDYLKERDSQGLVLARQGKLEEALARFSEAVQFWPNDANFHSNRGMMLMQLQRTGEAVDEFRRALRLGLPPDLTASVATNLGWLLFEEGKTGEAMEQYSEVLRKNPNFALAHGNLAKALEKLGRNEEAVREFKTVLDLEPGNQEARQSMESLTAGAGR